MRRDVPRLGLATPLRTRTLRDIALEMLEISREGLHRRARRSAAGEDETHFLDPLVRDRRLRPHPGRRVARTTSAPGGAAM